jgi:CDP-glucose 4,6-dehydratase
MRKKVNHDFWRERRVLVTGHTGFKGSWLCLWLRSMGAVVRGIALTPPTNPSLFEEASVADGMDSITLDIRDFAKVRASMEEFKPEVIFHMAAQPLVRRSYDEPLETYSTNFMGTLNVLEAARFVDTVKSIVNVTTDKCYENREWVWGYREEEPMGGHDPYSSSKGCVEIASNAYRKSFLIESGIGMATARAGNVIGGGDWAVDRLMPDVLRSLEEKRPVVLRNPQATRPWQHVLEPLSGYLMLAERLFIDGQIYAEGWNFGPVEDDCQSVQWVVDKLCQAWGETASFVVEEKTQRHEANLLKLDISKARHRLGWEPTWKLTKSIKNIVGWHKSWLAGKDMRAVCLEQICEYCTSSNFQ